MLASIDKPTGAINNTPISRPGREFTGAETCRIGCRRELNLGENFIPEIYPEIRVGASERACQAERERERDATRDSIKCE